MQMLKLRLRHTSCLTRKTNISLIQRMASQSEYTENEKQNTTYGAGQKLDSFHFESRYDNNRFVFGEKLKFCRVHLFLKIKVKKQNELLKLYKRIQ